MAASAFRKIDSEIYQEWNWRNCKITRCASLHHWNKVHKNNLLLIFIGKCSTFHEILPLKSVTVYLVDLFKRYYICFRYFNVANIIKWHNKKRLVITMKLHGTIEKRGLSNERKMQDWKNIIYKCITANLFILIKRI